MLGKGNITLRTVSYTLARKPKSSTTLDNGLKTIKLPNTTIKQETKLCTKIRINKLYFVSLK